MRENRQKKNTVNNGDEYEKLLQQSETKIRELIRVIILNSSKKSTTLFFLE